jgi:hypothetical protein
MATRVKIDAAKRDAYSKRLAIERVVRLANRIQDDARRRLIANGNVDTGNLVRSIRIRITTTRYKVKGEVGSSLRYALVVHNGAKPHLIRPRRRTGMKFYWPAGVGNPPLTTGKVVCFKGVVHHPGFKSNRYLLIPLVIESPRLGFYPTPTI